ncbi:MAG: DUF192 domain-containing protein [bacterium]|nr:DUF192 domain-containing protein [bacterium]
MPRRMAALAPIAAALLSCSGDPSPLPLERATLTAGGKAARVEVARRPHEQARGLMFRRRLGEDEGMLFVYDSPQTLCFWMKNTRLPLDIAFMDAGGRITQVERMRPHDAGTRHCSETPAQFALEMNRGWFERNGVGVGDRVELPRDIHIADRI